MTLPLESTERPVRGVKYGFDTTRPDLVTLGSQRCGLRRWDKCSSVWRSGILLMGTAVLFYLHLRVSPLDQYRSLGGEVQTPVLHFSMPGATYYPPTGLFKDDNQTWHLYFQYNSNALEGASWGHAISSDLYTWNMQPIALQSDHHDIMAGSTVIDKNNTSGFFPNQTNGVVALYTKHHKESGTEVLAMAYSVDGGYTFVHSTRTLNFPKPFGKLGMRHPQLSWHDSTQRWVMVVVQRTSNSVVIYTSPNLIDWVAASELSNKYLLGAGQGIDYPTLIPIPRLNSTGATHKNHPKIPVDTIKDFGDYLLVISFRKDSPLNGGSVTRYFPGKFNGSHFDSTDIRTDQFLDFGPDNYGTRFFSGLSHGNAVVGLGLASNHHYTNSTPESFGSRQTSLFTIPREGYLIHEPGEGELSFLSHPVDLDSLRGENLANISAQQLCDHSVLFNESAVLVEASIEMQPPDDEIVEWNIDIIFTSSQSPGLLFCTIIFGTWTAEFGCDRSQRLSDPSVESSVLDQMATPQLRTLLPFHNPAVRRWEVQAIMDRSILEVFLNGGVKSGTMRTHSDFLIDSVHFQGSDIPPWAALSITVHTLEPKQSV